MKIPGQLCDSFGNKRLMGNGFSHFHNSDDSGLDQKLPVFLDVSVRRLGLLPSFDFVCHVDRNFCSLVGEIPIIAN